MGVVLMSPFRDWFHITLKQIFVGDDIFKSWVMFNWDIYQALMKLEPVENGGCM